LLSSEPYRYPRLREAAATLAATEYRVQALKELQLDTE